MVSSDPDHSDQFPPEPIRRKRIPAGQAILVMLVTLILVVFLDADGLVRTAQRQDQGWQRNVALFVMHPIQDVAGFFQLTRPRQWLADATGHDQSTDFSSTKGVQLASPTASKPKPKQTGPTTTTTLPHYRTPTKNDPLHILVAGDSLSGYLGPSLARELVGLPATVTEDEHVGTGLARPDVVDWPKELQATVDRVKPEVVVLFLGGNDDQSLRTTTGWIQLDDTKAWRNEYQRRIAQLMNIAAQPGVSVYWIGLPAMGKAHLNAVVPTINRLTKLEANARSGRVTWVDSGKALNGAKGEFVTYLPGNGGQQVIVRENDGVHPTPAGMDRIVDEFSTSIITSRHLTSAGETESSNR